MVGSHLQTFLNKPVQDFQPPTVIDPEKYVYRLRIDYDDEGVTISDLLEALVRDPQAGNIKELIIGQFNSEASESSFEATGSHLFLPGRRHDRVRCGRQNMVHQESKGKACRTGDTVISVDGNGNIYRCHFIKEKLAICISTI